MNDSQLTEWSIILDHIAMSLPILNLRWYHFLLVCFYFCFYPWPYLYTKRVNLLPETASAFSIAVQVFRNSFLKICPLFGQILITCMKCSRASFSPSFCSEKMRWDEVEIIVVPRTCDNYKCHKQL